MEHCYLQLITQLVFHYSIFTISVTLHHEVHRGKTEEFRPRVYSQGQ